MNVYHLYRVITEEQFWKQNMARLIDSSSQSYGFYTVGSYFLPGVGHRLSFPNVVMFDLNFPGQTPE